MTITRLHASRTYIVTKGRHARSIVLTFRLRHRARVTFTVVQISPACRVVTSFSVVGHRGMNRIKLHGKIHGRRITPGTYRIAARTPRGGSVLFTTVVVRTRKPGAAELASALHANACAAAELAVARFAGIAVASILGSGSGPTQGPSTIELVRNQNRQGSTGATLSASGRQQPNIGAFSPTDVRSSKSAFAIAALGAALILLGLAALPRAAIPDPRLTDVIVRHRAEVAIAGAAALAAAIVSLVFG